MNKRINRVAWLAGCGLTAAMAAAEPSPEGWQLEWGPAWSVAGDFAKGKDMSAAASVIQGEGLVASDETRAAQRVLLDGARRMMTVRETVPLVPGKGAELDLEGAAGSSQERGYFLVGSQALSRQSETFESDRGHVFKLPVDAAGRPQGGAVAKADLRAVLAADKSLAPYLNQPAEANGLDIEGVAVRGGRLFFGLRAPVIEAQATVLEAGIEDLFSGRATLTHHRLPLGRGRGLRDLVALEGDAGFLMLAGSSGGPDGGRSAGGASYELWHWPGPGSPAALIGPLGAVSGEPDAKAEALMVLSQSATTIQGLVLHDGPKNGAPHEFRLRLPTRP